tara:strand:+ start:161 stop:1291 length:1131 start_codon:yes stop_codon:yes gene_type:complete
MKFLFLCGSRGEWGYIRPIIDLCIKRKIKYGICLTNMVLLDQYGNLAKTIKKKYKVVDEIEMSLEGSTHFSMTKSLSIFKLNFTETLKREMPNWLVLAGDRGEQLMASISAAYTYTPVCHIQAGERSGNIDGVARHAIARFSHVHFASNEDAANRLYRTGEESFRIYNVGAPQLDEIKNNKISSLSTFKNKYQISELENFFLVVFHPVTEEYKKVKINTKKFIKALNYFDNKKIWILPNNDAGSAYVKDIIMSKRKINNLIFDNLQREDYLMLLKNCKLIIGNSSSGILEAPSFKKGSLNVGNRQLNRVKAKSTQDSSYETNEIIKKIKLIQSSKFQKKLKKISNPYGEGNSSKKIVDILLNIKVDEKFLTKKLTY